MTPQNTFPFLIVALLAYSIDLQLHYALFFRKLLDLYFNEKYEMQIRAKTVLLVQKFKIFHHVNNNSHILQCAANIANVYRT